MIDRRTLCGAAMGIAAMSALSACGGQEGGSQGGAETVPASWLKCRVGKLSEIDPLLVQDRAGLQVLSAVFTPLMRSPALRCRAPSQTTRARSRSSFRSTLSFTMGSA